MTFEEMQKIIEGMLAVQRELQESQLELKESQAEFRDSQAAQRDVLDELIQKYGDLAEQSIRQKEILDRLISLTNESDHLNFEEKLQALEARRKRIKNRNQLSVKV